uniref:Cytochrome c oxidase subunit 2 n=1 Tax=Euseius nicholsi TaxID=702746 RepID=A0A0U1ZEG1_9ACAR|nr:cytochrome c oxidase subunit II [Euseius nicholsi]
MAFWMDTYFMEVIAPTMDYMVMFHDFSMSILFSILIFLFLMMISGVKFKILDLNLMENQTVEIIWTVMPMFLLVFIAFSSLRLLYLMEEMFFPDLSIKVMGYQWYWSYDYIDFELDFDSYYSSGVEYVDSFRLLENDLSLALPVNCTVRFLVSSADVIHSWTVPVFGVKTDAIPGRLNQVNLYSYRPGIYFGQCSEICGINHSFMPISLGVMEMEDFVSWVD